MSRVKVNGATDHAMAPSKWLPGVMAHSALLWLELPIRISGKWWCDKRIEVLD